jgi:putative membrane protein
MKRDKWKIKLLWLLLGLTIIISFTGVPFNYFGLKPLFVIHLLPLVILFLHISIVFSFRRGLLLLLLSSLTGFLFEVVGVRYGTVFGGQYEYQNENFGFMSLGVPRLVPVYWSIFIYTGYSIVTSFLVWVDENKPSIKNKNLALLLLLVILDGLVVTAIDIFMDPLMVYEKRWIWLEGGPYFGVPIGNFIGWFVVTLIATGIFRTFEYFFPLKPARIDKSIYLAPVLGYLGLCLSFAISAVKIGFPQLALIGFFAMAPIVVANLIFFMNWRNNNLCE